MEAQCGLDAAAAAADVVACSSPRSAPRSCRGRSGRPACRPGAPGSSAPRTGRRPADPRRPGVVAEPGVEFVLGRGRSGARSVGRSPVRRWHAPRAVVVAALPVGVGLIAASWVVWVPIWSAVARAQTARISAAGRGPGGRPPIPAPACRPSTRRPRRRTFDAQPSASATSASTWSRTVIPGNRIPTARPSGASDDGPVVPRQPPSTLVARTHHSVGVDRGAGPDQPVPPAGRRMLGFGRTGDVRVAGQRVQRRARRCRGRRRLTPAPARRG